jgi:hypothetical protein
MRRIRETHAPFRASRGPFMIEATEGYATLRALSERLAVRLALFSLLSLVVVAFLVPGIGSLNEFRDAQVIALHEHAAVDAVRRFGELPLWNPWYCGGFSAIGAAQSRFASPLFIVDLLVGAERGEPIVVYVLLVAGMEGTYRWVRLRVTDAFAALRVAPIFALSGQFAVAIHRGWIHFFGFEVAPWILFGITLAARGRFSGVVVAAASFAFVLAFGGTFAAPLLAVAAVLEAARAFWEQPRSSRRRAFVHLCAAASSMTLLSAFRLWPLAETLAASPRIMAGTPGHGPLTLVSMLIGALRVQDGDVGNVGQFYVGTAFLALLALGSSDRRALVPFLFVLLFMWLGAGYARKPALFGLLRELPVFEALRYPERFLWLAILYASEPVTRALIRIPLVGEGALWRKWTTVALSITLLFSLGSELASFRRVIAGRQLGAIAVERRSEFRQARGNRWLAAHYDSIGVGSLSCWEPYPVVMSPLLRGDLFAEEYLRDDDAGHAKRVAWSPSELVVHVDLVQSTRLYVNQNWHPGWHTSIGEVVQEEGLLAVDLPPGAHDVRLRFRPRSAFAGLFVSLAVLVSFLAGRRWRLLAQLAPWGVVMLFVATWTEPVYPKSDPKNPDGSPALASDVAPEASRTLVQFDRALSIEGVEIGEPDGLDNVPLVLWMRRTGRLPRTTGIFLEIVPRGAKDPPTISADHQVVGGSFFLSEAPRGALVRDAFAVNTKKAARGTYDVWLSVGHVSGKKGRVGASGPDVVDHRARIGSIQLP